MPRAWPQSEHVPAARAVNVDESYARYSAARARLWHAAIAWVARMTGAGEAEANAIIGRMKGTPPGELEAASVAFAAAEREAVEAGWHFGRRRD